MQILPLKDLVLKFFYLSKERKCATLIFPRQQWGSLGKVKIKPYKLTKIPQNSLQNFRTF